MSFTRIRGSKQIMADSILDAQISPSAAIQLSKLAEAVIQADGGQAFTADQSFGGFKATNLADPVSAQDAATKAYVDASASGLDIKGSVRVATTAAGTLAIDFENLDIIDGVTLATGDRILIKNQTTGSENGIYVVQASGAPVRSTDADQDAEVTSGMFCFVEEGSINADTGWVLSTDGAIVVGTTALAFTQFSSAGVVDAGAGLAKTGTTIDVVSGDDSLTVNANDMSVKRDVAGALGLSTSGIAVNVDSTTVEILANSLQVKDLGISSAKIASNAVDASKIASSVAGDGLAGGGGVALSVNVDNSTIETNLDSLRVKAGGISTSHLATDSVDKTIIASDVAGLGLSQAVGGELDVNVDNSSVEINVDTLQVKAGGITNSHIATDSIDKTKVAADIAGLGLSQAVGGELDVNVDNSSVEINVDTLRVKDAGITAAKLAAAVAGNGLTGGAGSALAVGAGNGISVSADAIALALDGSTLKVSGAGVALADLASGKVLVGDGSNVATARTPVVQETPSGILDGVNTSFSLANTPSNTVALYLNGIRQVEGAGESYQISGSTITFVEAPLAGDKIRCDYQY